MKKEDYEAVAEIIAAAIRYAGSTIAERLAETLRAASLRQTEALAQLNDTIGATVASQLCSGAEHDSEGENPGNLADGLFAIARALQRLAPAREKE